MALIIGIDMGTTNSAVAFANDDGETRVLGPETAPTIPSAVVFDGELLRVEAEASEKNVDARNTFRGVKRLLGRKAHSPEVARLARAVPFRVAASPTGDCWVRVGDRPTPPQELAGALLRSLRIRAEEDLDEPVTRAVLAVPAYFDDAQRQAVRDAGKIAGLEVVRLINEPTAAALAYGMSGRASTIAVFDLGGGTFDVSILRVENDVFSVLASHGDASLGGDDWDRRILDLLLDELFSTHRFDATTSPEALAILRMAAERAKVELSGADSANISISLTTPKGVEIELERTLSLEEFERESSDLRDRLARPCRLALADAGLTAEDIDEVLLVGGMTKVPMVRRAVANLLGEPSESAVDPATAVARGAAVCAAVLAGSDAPTTLLDVSSHTLSVRVGDIEIPRAISRGEELPARRVLRFEVPQELAENLTIELFRGEEGELDDNTSVGRVSLELSNTSNATGPREVELTISIDVNSIVGVRAFDVASGMIAQSRLRTRGALSESQLVRIVGSDVLEAAGS